jgi:DNA-binding PadR family transcriptional regulator
MELFAKLFSSLLLFVYHCFDRIVIHGYLSGLSRPEQVVYFFRDVIGVPVVDKAALSKRTNEYRNWVEAYARKNHIPMEWAQKGVRKEDYVRPWLRRMERAGEYGVYFIFQSMEQGATFRCSVPKFPTQDPNHRILKQQRSRYMHYYFYLRDETLGAMVMRVASFFPFQATYFLNGHSFIEQELNRSKIGFRKNDNAFLSVDDVPALQGAADRLTGEVIRKRLDHWTLVLGPKFSTRERGAMNLNRFYAVNQIEYCRNFIFKRHFPIHRIFERSCEIGLWRLTAHQISEIFGSRVTKKLKGKLHTTLEQVEHGHHIFRAYFKHAFVKQYEKFSTFLRNEICSNNLSDFRLKKGLEHLAAVREKFLAITDRFATFQAQSLNVHVEFPLLQRLALPITVGTAKFPGIKIHDTRMIRLMEVLLHGGTTVGGWTAKQIHEVVLATFELPLARYGLTQLLYDLRKMKAHGLVERDGKRYAYRLTDKGTKVALTFVLFHQRLCGPLANSLFHHQPDTDARPNSKLEAAYHKADAAILNIIQLLEAA